LTVEPLTTGTSALAEAGVQSPPFTDTLALELRLTALRATLATVFGTVKSYE
jgi:hypothetical protein